jgi:hypothetical protein
MDVCDAIDYAHSRGVLHRDIKPRNIIVGKHGETLVVDWGLAKATGRSEPGAEERTLLPTSASGSAETSHGSTLGTPAYMSPEQARGDIDSLGPQSDVYSLGDTLYCLLTGKPLQEADDVGEMLRKVQRSEFAPPRQLDPLIDKALEAVCLKAMALELRDRCASCRALAEDIERWMADESVTDWGEPWTRTLLRWLTRHRTGVTGAAAAGLVALVGLVGVAAVQTRANAELARSKAAVQARYDLAVEAIKTYHTGMSEDSLLKEDKFKDLRDRLLKSAVDFHERLGALLKDQTDLPSRRALLKANYKVAALADKVGRKEDALAMHTRRWTFAKRSLARRGQALPLRSTWPTACWPWARCWRRPERPTWPGRPTSEPEPRCRQEGARRRLTQQLELHWRRANAGAACCSSQLATRLEVWPRWSERAICRMRWQMPIPAIKTSSTNVSGCTARSLTSWQARAGRSRR